MRSSEELDTRNAEEQPRWQQRQLPASDQPTPSHTGQFPENIHSFHLMAIIFNYKSGLASLTD